MSGYTGQAPDTEPARVWLASAACREVDPELLFPTPGDTRRANQAKEICRLCPVRQACLDDAMTTEGGRTTDTRYGIRGGLGPAGRRNRYEQARKQRQRQAVA